MKTERQANIALASTDARRYAAYRAPVARAERNEWPRIIGTVVAVIVTFATIGMLLAARG